jgi:hypothetical protein
MCIDMHRIEAAAGARGKLLSEAKVGSGDGRLLKPSKLGEFCGLPTWKPDRVWRS